MLFEIDSILILMGISGIVGFGLHTKFQEIFKSLSLLLLIPTVILLLSASFTGIQIDDISDFTLWVNSLIENLPNIVSSYAGGVIGTCFARKVCKNNSF